MNLSLGHPGLMAAVDVAVGQALADVASIGILHQHLLPHTETVKAVADPLYTRMITDQAKVILTERAAIDTDRAFHLLRARTLKMNRRIADSPAPWSTAHARRRFWARNPINRCADLPHRGNDGLGARRRH